MWVNNFESQLREKVCFEIAFDRRKTCTETETWGPEHKKVMKACWLLTFNTVGNYPCVLHPPTKTWLPTSLTNKSLSGAVWKSRWPSWAPVPNKPTVSVDVKQHLYNNKSLTENMFAWPTCTIFDAHTHTHTHTHTHAHTHTRTHARTHRHTH